MVTFSLCGAPLMAAPTFTIMFSFLFSFEVIKTKALLAAAWLTTPDLNVVLLKIHYSFLDCFTSGCADSAHCFTPVSSSLN